VPYCHGAEGTAGRAPRLAGRAFNPQYLFNTVLYGKPHTGMPGFMQQLKTADVEAVTQYVLSLGSTAPAVDEKSAGPELPPEARRGRELFFDAVRMGSCGKCHELEDRGSPVAVLRKGSADLPKLREIAARDVVTATPDGEDAFPALVVEQTAERVRVYDLSAALPVLRTFAAGKVRITKAASWSHSAALDGYSDAELQAIAAWLAMK
jgi:mono/diheme cytochrome c family protein